MNLIKKALTTLAALFYCFALSLQAQSDTAKDTTKSIDLQPITVSSTLAFSKTPMTFTNLNKDHIRQKDNGQDIPFLLKGTPSVVETSDAGAGIGYTGLRIRGSDATRINITIDGVPLNDAESQLVYWVNMPDFVSSTSMIQVQRGLGTSTNGAGAFGATVNLVTNAPSNDPFAQFTGAYGSFNTQRYTLAAGTGLLGNHWAFDGRASLVRSDGYIDRASSDLKSFYLSGTYLNGNTSIKAKVFSGNEETYQAWYGVPQSYLSDKKLRRYNPAGYIRTDSTKGDIFYPNQTDNYTQTHAHIIANQLFKPQLRGQLAVHYTKGKGYYEEYRADEKLTKYFSNWAGVPQSDLIRQLWLDNHFYGLTYALIFDKNKINNTIGGGFNQYRGDHFGKVIWMDKEATIAQSQPNFYENNALKTDFTLYNKINYAFSKQLNGFIDVQYRYVGYTTKGVDRRLNDITRNEKYHFFNPKIGLLYAVTEGGSVYASVGIGHREPNRNDITEAPVNRIPRPERLVNTEIGYRYQSGKLQYGVNFYQMVYDNQLIVTGNINDVGEQIRVNVPDSYRMGLELEAAWSISPRLAVSGNATLSNNKIKNFREYIDNWDTGQQVPVERGTTNIAFSPNIIGNLSLQFDAFKKGNNTLSVSPSYKYVGKQFIDNSSNERTMLPAFGYADILLQYSVSTPKVKQLYCKLLINNVLNKQYVNNAWTYRFISANYDPRPDDPTARLEQGSTYNLSGFFPQAGRHFIFTVGLSF